MAGSINLFQNIVAQRDISISNQQGKWFFSALQPIPQAGGLYLFHDKVLTSIIPLKAVDDYVAKKASIQVSQPDPDQDFYVEISVNNEKERILTLPAGNTVAVSTIFVPIKENDQIALIVYNETGNTYSNFSDITVVIDYEYSEIYQERNGNPFTINDVISSFNGSLTDISSSFETTKQELATTYNSFSSSIFIDVDEFRSGISGLQSDLSTTNLNLEILQGNYNLDIPALQTEATNLNQSFLDLTTNVSNEVSNIGSNFTSLSSSMSSLHNTLSGHFYTLSGNLDSFDFGQIDLNKQSIATINSDLATKQETIDSLLLDVGSNYENINTLTNTVNNNNENINTLLTEVSSALKSDINTLQSNIASVNSLLGYNVNLNAANISNLEAQINNMNGASNGETYDHTALETNIANITLALESLSGDVSSNSNIISSLQSNVSSIDESKIVLLNFFNTNLATDFTEVPLNSSNSIPTDEIPVVIPCNSYILRGISISTDANVSERHTLHIRSEGIELASFILAAESSVTIDLQNLPQDVLDPQNSLSLFISRETTGAWEFSKISATLSVQIL